MEENNRPHRRIRTRPLYDLRRKVLLKNFLREQMSPRILQTPFANTETVHLTTDNSPEDEIVDIEDVEYPSDKIDSENRIEMEVDNEDPLMFDFTKITESKLSKFNFRKRESPSLSAEAVKAIVDKNSAHFESSERKGKEKNKNAKAKHKYSMFISPFKRKPINELEKKRGITKAKNALKSSKLSFKQKQLDKSDPKSKSKLHKVRKMIAAVHQAIKGDSPKIKNMPVENIKLDCTKQPLPQHKSNSVRSSNGSFSNRIQIDFENEENNANVPDRVQILKEIDKRQYCQKHAIPFESYRIRSVLKDPNNLLSRFLKRKTLKSESNLQEQDRFCISCSLNEIRKLEKANKRLKEENKLLSENLSNIMADFDVTPEACRQRSIYSPHQSRIIFSCKEKTDHIRAGYESPVCMVLRSRSVQDRGERRREIKLRLSSQSMRHQQYSRIPPRTLYRAKPCIINPNLPEEVPLPYPDKPPGLPLPSEHNYSKPISRRSSMPQRISRAPLVNRRSSFSYETRSYTRQNLLSLPTEAFY